MGDIFGTTKTELNPTVIYSAHYNTEGGLDNIVGLAISPDDRRVFSGGVSQGVRIHDIEK